MLPERSTRRSACNAGGASVTAYAFSFDFPGVPGADEIITAATLTLNVWDDFGQADGSRRSSLVLDVDDILRQRRRCSTTS